MDLALATAAVTPGALAADRTLPVGPAWESVLPDGLVRGRSIACTGLTAPSLALSLLAGPLDTGAWLAVVDLPWLGVEAAREQGVPLDRIVRIDTRRPTRRSDGGTRAGSGDGSRRERGGDGGRHDDGGRRDDGDRRGGGGRRDGGGRHDDGGDRGELWAEVVAAATDGFDCILTRIPRHLPAGLVRRIGTRLRHRGSILVALGDPGPLSADVTVTADSPRWDGLDRGHGHLRGRRLEVAVAGRRMPRDRRVALHLPTAEGGTAVAVPEPTELRPRATVG